LDLRPKPGDYILHFSRPPQNHLAYRDEAAGVECRGDRGLEISHAGGPLFHTVGNARLLALAFRALQASRPVVKCQLGLL